MNEVCGKWVGEKVGEGVFIHGEGLSLCEEVVGRRKACESLAVVEREGATRGNVTGRLPPR